jgi:DNA-binding response OmpR family regulator
MRRLLMMENFEAICVGGLSSARHLLDRVRFDALILDLLLPDGFGGDLLADFGAGRLPSIPVLIVSAARDAKAVAYEHSILWIAKPFEAGALVDALHDTIRRALRPKKR